MTKYEREYADFVAEQERLMKPSTRSFAEKQCAENGRRMAREAKGDYRQPIFIVP